jgi:hypothetical protein
LGWLQEWYASQCDGDWEHEFGIKITTLDNPGWSITIDLEGATLSGRTIDRLKVDRTDLDWIACWIEQNRFEACCGPRNMEEVLTVFRRFTETPDSRKM